MSLNMSLLYPILDIKINELRTREYETVHIDKCLFLRLMRKLKKWRFFSFLINKFHSSI